MKEIKGNIFDQTDADAICVTTCGVVKSNGELVMGAGIAKQFANRYPLLAKHLGGLVSTYGNQVYGYSKSYGSNVYVTKKEHRPVVFSFPTKHDWKDPSSLKLIEESAEQLVEKANFCDFTKIVLPRPGCGLGQLNWEDVKAVIEPILDDRFYIITPITDQDLEEAFWSPRKVEEIMPKEEENDTGTE